MNTTVFFDFPLPVQIAVVVWGVAHILLAIWALIRLTKDKRTHIMGLNKVGWAVIILFAQVIGSLYFLIAYTKEQRSRDQVRAYHDHQESGQNRSAGLPSSVVDDLYRK